MLESQIQHRKEAIEDIKQWVTSLYSAWLHKFGFPSNVVYKRIMVDLWAKTIFISIKSIPHNTPVYAEAVIYVSSIFIYSYQELGKWVVCLDMLPYCTQLLQNSFIFTKIKRWLADIFDKKGCRIHAILWSRPLLPCIQILYSILYACFILAIRL